MPAEASASLRGFAELGFRILIDSIGVLDVEENVASINDVGEVVRKVSVAKQPCVASEADAQGLRPDSIYTPAIVQPEKLPSLFVGFAPDVLSRPLPEIQGWRVMIRHAKSLANRLGADASPVLLAELAIRYRPLVSRRAPADQFRSLTRDPLKFGYRRRLSCSDSACGGA